MILTICASRKSEDGRFQRPSAVRSLLAAAREGLRRVGKSDTYLDFASVDLPPFEGLPLADYDGTDAAAVAGALAEADTVVLGAPAYWGGLSGLAKNFIDLSGGADYSRESAPRTPWAGKCVAMLVVGAAVGDAQRGHAQLAYALEAQGASLFPHALVLDRPHGHDPQDLIRRAFALGVAVGRRKA